MSCTPVFVVSPGLGVGLGVSTGATDIEILMSLINYIISGICYAEVAVVRLPIFGGCPLIPLNDNRRIHVNGSNCIHSRLRRLGPGLWRGHIVRFVHKVVARNGRVAI